MNGKSQDRASKKKALSKLIDKTIGAAGEFDAGEAPHRAKDRLRRQAAGESDAEEIAAELSAKARKSKTPLGRR